MAEQLTPDLCVIGAGSGGLSVAAAAAALRRAGGADREGPDGRRVPQHRLRAVEGDDRGGRRAEAMRASGPFGIKPVRPGVEFDQVNDHIHRVIDAIAPNDSKERFTGLGVRVIEGEARFRDTRTVVVGDEPDIRFEIKARRFVIATGSLPVVPPISGLEQVPYLTNETVFETRERPKHLIVHRRRPDRARAGAGVPPARLRGHRAGGGAAARQGGPGMRRHRARRVRARGHHHPQRRQGRAGAAAQRAHRGGAGRRHRGDHPGHRSAGRDRPAAEHRRPRSRRRAHQARADRHRGQPAAAHHQQARLCHRRRHRRAAVHPRRQSPGRRCWSATCCSACRSRRTSTTSRA